MKMNPRVTLFVCLMSFGMFGPVACGGTAEAGDGSAGDQDSDSSEDSAADSAESNDSSNTTADPEGEGSESEESSTSGETAEDSSSGESSTGSSDSASNSDEDSDDASSSSDTGSESEESSESSSDTEDEESSESNSESTGDDTEESTSDSSDEEESSDSSDEEETGDDPETDCDNLPSMPVPQDKVKKLDQFKGAEDFTFDKEGYRIRTEDSSGNMFRDDYDGKSTIWVPKVMDGGSWPRGQRMLPNGDMVVVNNKKKLIVRVDTKDKSAKDLAWDLPTPNGIAIGLDGQLYVANKAAIYRIDPDGENSKEEFFKLSGKSFDGISFSPDYKTLYFAEEKGVLHALSIKADGSAGEHREVTKISGNLDGMAVDECNNVYISDITSTGVWRVSPEGKAEKVFNASSTPAVNFGTGIGGWKETSIYVSTFSGGLYEVEVGVRGKKEPHLD